MGEEAFEMELQLEQTPYKNHRTTTNTPRQQRGTSKRQKLPIVRVAILTVVAITIIAFLCIDIIHEYSYVDAEKAPVPENTITRQEESDVTPTIPVGKTPESEEEQPEPVEKQPKTVEEQPTYAYTVTDEGRLALTKLVYAEAGCESLKGKIAVAAVALNRYASDVKFFNRTSIISVITQKGQFADISKVTQEDLENCPECKEAVELALRGEDPTREYFPEGALYFFNPDLVEGDEKAEREGIDVYTIGNHSFHVNFEKVK